MYRLKQRVFFIFSCAVLFSACNTLKYVPKDDALYKGAEIRIEGSDVTTRQRKVLRSDLKTLTRPKPNTRFLGMPFRLWIYNAVGGSPKETSLRGRLKYGLGEPPVLLSQLNLQNNVDVLRSYLENKGFFHAQVKGDTIVKKRKATARYTARPGIQYTINKVDFPTDSTLLTQNIAASKVKSLLKAGAPFDLDVIKTERIRIDAFLKERGFYFFSPDFILVQVDSTIGNKKVNLFVTVKPGIPTVAKELYTINNVFIYADYNLTTANIDTNKANATLYNGYFIIDKENKYKSWLLDHSMQFKTGEPYNRADHNQTLSRLINLNLFKYVKNRFEPAIWLDSPKLNAYYYLTPMAKKSLRAEITALTKSNNLNGTEVRLNWRNRNTFRGGEQLSFTTYAGSEIQFGGTLRGYNTYRTGAEATIAMPKFLIPFLDVRNEGAFAPRTLIRLGYDVLNKRKLYTLNSFRGRYGYTWKENITKQHELYPVDINYVQPFRLTQRYLDSVVKNPVLRNPTERQFILGSNYRFNFDQSIKGPDLLNTFYFDGIADFSGNLAGLFRSGNVQQGDTAKLFNAAFAQYIKFQTDGRYYRKLGIRNTWANRIILGYGLPYGNSSHLPFIKQFFAGGSNSIRAFRSRNVGPGTYKDTSSLLIDQTGDIRLELNTEYRQHLSGPLYGAAFIDAGNVWLKNEDPLRPGARFSKDFLKELAVGAGLGIRLDVTVFVIRLDAAFPLRKPWEQNPWVMNQIRLHKPQWRRENIIYNLAIGYPF